MKKISTLFETVFEPRYQVINTVREDNKWVFETGIPTQKFDGSACIILNGELYKRYDVKKGKVVPEGAIPCQEADPVTGHHPHWIKCCIDKAEDKYHMQAFSLLEDKEEGATYEICGEKFQKNPEKIEGNLLIKHGSKVLQISDFSFESIKSFLETTDIEGIVFHDSSGLGRMCKIRKSDFGFIR